MHIDNCFSQVPFPMEQHAGEIRPFVDWLVRRDIKSVVEIGVRHGGTSALWSLVFNARVVGVDRRGPDSLGGAAFDVRKDALMTLYPRYLFVEGDSHDPRTVDQVKSLAGEIDFLFLDGDHSYAGVKQDFDQYGPLVRTGGVIAFHDIANSDFMKSVGHGVCKFWQELGGEKHEFCIGHDWGGIGAFVK